MVSIVAGTFALVVWIVLWALGAKPFDAMLAGLVFFLPAAAWQVFSPGIKKMMGQTPPPSTGPR
jgi:hypothetical protein